jgi:hypothetical protein
MHASNVSIRAIDVLVPVVIDRVLVSPSSNTFPRHVKEIMDDGSQVPIAYFL